MNELINKLNVQTTWVEDRFFKKYFIYYYYGYIEKYIYVWIDR